MLSFGGPAGQIATMHRILVEEKKWIGETRFLHAFNYCMLLPGPEAQQLATYIGWLLHKTKGGLVAGTLFVLPGFVCIMVMSWIYALLGNIGVVQALFFGLKAAVLAIVLDCNSRRSLSRAKSSNKYNILLAPKPSELTGVNDITGQRGKNQAGLKSKLSPPESTLTGDPSSSTSFGRGRGAIDGGRR